MMASTPEPKEVVRRLSDAMAEWIRSTDRATKDVLIEDGLERTLNELGLGELIAAGQAMRESLVSLWKSDYETRRNPYPESNDPTIAAYDEAYAKLCAGGADHADH